MRKLNNRQINNRAPEEATARNKAKPTLDRKRN